MVSEFLYNISVVGITFSQSSELPLLTKIVTRSKIIFSFQILNDSRLTSERIRISLYRYHVKFPV